MILHTCRQSRSRYSYCSFPEPRTPRVRDSWRPRRNPRVCSACRRTRACKRRSRFYTVRMLHTAHHRPRFHKRDHPNLFFHNLKLSTYFGKFSTGVKLQKSPSSLPDWQTHFDPRHVPWGPQSREHRAKQGGHSVDMVNSIQCKKSLTCGKTQARHSVSQQRVSAVRDQERGDQWGLNLPVCNSIRLNAFNSSNIFLCYKNKYQLRLY